MYRDSSSGFIHSDSGDSYTLHLRELFTSSTRLRLVLPMWLVWFCFGCTYYGVILFTGRLFEDSGSDDDADDDGSSTCSFDYLPMFLSAASEFVGCTVTALTIDRYGRVHSQAAMYSVACLGCVLMGFLASTHWSLQVVMWSFAARLGSFAASSATWVHTPELLPTEMRGTGHAAANIFAQIGSFFTPFLVYNLSPRAVGLFLGALNFCAVCGSLMLPETTGFTRVLCLYFLTLFFTTCA